MKGWFLTLPWLPYPAMALFPFVLVRKKSLPAGGRLINHERIHLRQQIELLVLPFYIWYLCEYLLRLLIERNHHKAYRKIWFEREAYAFDKDPDYLKNRRFWNFIRIK